MRADAFTPRKKTPPPSKKPQAKPAAFRPLGDNVVALARPVARPKRQVPADPRIPIVPTLQHPTAAQDNETRHLLGRYVAQHGQPHADSATDAKRLAPLLAAAGRKPAQGGKPTVFNPKAVATKHAGLGDGRIVHPLLSAVGLGGAEKYLLPLEAADYTAGTLLKQLDRPVHAGAAAVLAAQGKPIGDETNPLKAGIKGFLHLNSPEGRAYYGDVGKAHGSHGAGQFIAGLGADILLNPLSATSLGAKPVASALEESASQFNRLAAAAHEAGDVSKAARYAKKAQKLNLKAADAPTNKGFQFGLQVRRPGGARPIGFKSSGATTARLSAKLGVSKAATHARELPLTQIIAKRLAPDFKPKEVTQAVWDASREARLKATATSRAGTKSAERRGEFFTSKLGHGEGEDLLNAIEEAPKDVAKAIETRDRVMTAGHRETPEYKIHEARIQGIVDASKARLNESERDAKAAASALKRVGKSESYQRGRLSVSGPQAARRLTKQLHKAEAALKRAETKHKPTMSVDRRERAIDKIQGALATHEAAALHAAGLGDEAAFAASEKLLKEAEVRLKPLIAERNAETRLAHAQADVAKLRPLKHGAALPVTPDRLKIPTRELGNLERLRGNLTYLEPHAAHTASVARGAAKIHAVTKANAKDARAALNAAGEDILHRYAEHSVRALPAYSIGELPEHLRPLAERMKLEYGKVAATEQDARVLDRLREGYIPHQWVGDIDERRVGQFAKAGRNQFNQRRTLAGSIKEINARSVARGEDPLFSVNAPGLLANRMGKSAVRVAHAEMMAEWEQKGVAKVLSQPEHLHSLRDIDGLYRMDKTGLHAIEDAHGSPDLGRAREDMAKGMKVVKIPKVIGDLERADKGFRGTDPEEKPFGYIADRVTSGIKTALTVLNVPAYDLRNMTGDLANAFNGGMDSRSFKDAVRLMKSDWGRQQAERKMLNPEEYLSKQTVNINGVHENALSLLTEAEHYGAIHAGYVGAEKHDIESSVLARRAHGEKKFTDKRGVHQLAHPVSSLRTFGDVRETMPRLGLYITRKRLGDTPAQAAKWTNRYLIDYGDLTDAEKSVWRRIFPFYTFAARNTRQQAGSFLRRPAPYATYESTRQEAANSAGLPKDWEAQLPNYQQRGLGIPVGRHKDGETHTLFPNLPINDLNRIAGVMDILRGKPGNELQQLFSNVHPVAKAAAELGFNENMFFRQAIQANDDTSADPSQHYYVPAPGYTKHLPDFAKEILGVHSGKDKQGNTIQKWPGRVDYLFRLLPQQNFATQVTTPTAGSHGQGPHDALLSQLTGLKFGSIKDDKSAQANAYKGLDHIGLLKRKLDDLSVPHNDPRYIRLRLLERAYKRQAQLAERRMGYKSSQRPKRLSGGGTNNIPSLSSGNIPSLGDLNP